MELRLHVVRRRHLREKGSKVSSVIFICNPAGVKVGELHEMPLPYLIAASASRNVMRNNSGE